MKRNATFFRLSGIHFILSFTLPLLFSLPIHPSRYPTAASAATTVLNCRGFSQASLYNLRARVAWNTFVRSFLSFSLRFLGARHLSRSPSKSGSSRCSNVRMTTDAAKWNYKVSLHYVGVLCFFSEIVVTGISMRDLCSLSLFLFLSLSLTFDDSPTLSAAIGWTLLRCQVLVFWEKGPCAACRLANPI